MLFLHFLNFGHSLGGVTMYDEFEILPRKGEYRILDRNAGDSVEDTTTSSSGIEKVDELSRKSIPNLPLNQSIRVFHGSALVDSKIKGGDN